MSDAGDHYLYACDNDACKVRLFTVIKTSLCHCPACKEIGRFIRRPLEKHEPRPYV